MGGKIPWQIEPKFFLEEDIRDVITCFKFGDDRFRGLASDEGQILTFPIDFDGRPYNTQQTRHCCHLKMIGKGFYRKWVKSVSNSLLQCKRVWVAQMDE